MSASAEVRFVATKGALTQIAKSGGVAGALQGAALAGAHSAGSFDGTSYHVRLYTHNKFRARAVVFADVPRHLARSKHADPMSAALRVHPRM